MMSPKLCSVLPKTQLRLQDVCSDLLLFAPPNNQVTNLVLGLCQWTSSAARPRNDEWKCG